MGWRRGELGSERAGFFLRRIHRQWRHHGDQLHDRGSKLPGYSTHPLKDEFRMCHLSRGWVLRTMTPKRDLLGPSVRNSLSFPGHRSQGEMARTVCPQPQSLILRFVWDRIDESVVGNAWRPVQEVLQREIQKRFARRKIRR